MTKENNENNYSVYVHTSPSGKMYVGITKQKPEYRWGRNGIKYKTQVFYRAIEKYGWDNIDHEIIAEHLTKEEAENFEIKLIDKLHTTDPKYGYNITTGGEGGNGLYGEKNGRYGKPVSEETKKKIRETKRLNPRKYTEEEIKRKSEKSKEVWAREGYREKMSGKNSPAYGRTGDKHPLYGKCGKDSATSKKVICLTTGEIYDSAKTASKEKGCNHSKICMCCRNEREFCGKDEQGNELLWMYYEDYLSTPQEEILKKKEKSLMRKIEEQMNRVVCVNTSEIYRGSSEASRNSNATVSGVSSVCNGKQKSAGKDKNGNPLHWMFYKDYINVVYMFYGIK